MNQAILREQLLKQDGLAGGYVPASVKGRIHREVKKRKIRRKLAWGTVAMSFVLAAAVSKLPDLAGGARQTVPNYTKGFMFHPESPLNEFHCGAMALLGFGFLILAGIMLQKWILRIRMAGIETSLGNPLQALRAARGREKRP